MKEKKPQIRREKLYLGNEYLQQIKEYFYEN